MCSQDKPFLERLGIHPDVQSFFKNHIIDTCESIIFKYGNSLEHASSNFHLIPTTEETWTAGEIMLAKHIIICGSAMDAIAWLHFHHYAYQSNLFFAAVGASPSRSQIETITRRNKQYHLVFSNDELGAVCDLKVASYVRKKPISILADEKHFTVTFRSKNYRLKHLSLHALEKAARFHFNIPVSKPQKFNTFYEQLTHRRRT
jgi:hypothetical protein